MNYRRITIEQILYLSALALAVFVRFVSLGRSPLSDFEAAWALQAWEISQGAAPAAGAAQAAALGSSPAYVFLTALLFKVFGSSAALARMAPALAGSLLVVAPWLLRQSAMPRRLFGRPAAVVMAFGLALDPGLVSQSRLAGSGMLAQAFFLLAVTCAFGAAQQRSRWIAAGTLAALALLSGPAALHGLVLILLVGLALAALPGVFDQFRDAPLPGSERESLAPGGLAFAATIVLAGTLLFLQPSGLGAWLNALPEYLAGWTAAPVESALKLLWLLVMYQPLALVFGVIGLGRALVIRRHADVMLAVWLAVSFLLVLVYPARQSGDLMWVLVPLWVLAARELGDVFSKLPEQVAFGVSHAVLILVMAGLFWLNLAGMANSLLDSQALYLRLAVLSGVVVLGALSTVLVGMGWSWNLARWGAVLGLTAALGFYMLAGLSGAALLRSDERWTTWLPAPGAGDAGLLAQTLEQLSLWQTGDRRSLDVLAAVDSPSLRWMLRDYPQAQFAGVEAASAAAPPSVVITRQSEESPSLASSYRGQDFIWWSYPEWQSGAPVDMLRWLAYRSQPWWQEKIVLWARVDLFPGDLQPGSGLIIPEELPEAELPLELPEEPQQP